MIKWIIIIAFIIFVIILFLLLNSRGDFDDSKKTNSHLYSSHTRTKEELIKGLPQDKQLDYTHLFESIDSLDKLISGYSSDISKRQGKLDQEIKEKFQRASDEIKKRWESQVQYKRYRECIALHYASFTLADSIYEQKEKVLKMFNRLKKMNQNLGDQIDGLSLRINNKTGNVREMKKQHQELCKKRSQVSKIQYVYKKNLDDYLSKVNYQNHLTEHYREYIGKNFGKQGNAWIDRLNKRKANKG